MAGNTLEVNSSNFDKEVLNSPVPVLVDFWATWCGPCKMIAPMLDTAAMEYSGKLTIAKLDVQNERGLAAKYGIRNIPALVLFQNGEPVDRTVGALNRTQLDSFLNKHV